MTIVVMIMLMMTVTMDNDCNDDGDYNCDDRSLCKPIQVL